MTVKASISLTDDQHRFAKTLVEAGRFASVSAVVQQGVELLKARLEADALEAAALAEVLGRRRSGAFVSGAEMDDRIARLVNRTRDAHARHD